ncbi:MAG: DUF2103 domain-containing protein [Thermosynechococcaceae cyanobacterium]
MADLPRRGRLVLNHSTHVPGLIPVLERLAKIEGIQTITPGVIGRAKAHAPQLRLKISVPIRGGFKVIARRGKTVQEIFVIGHLNRSDLESWLAQATG